MKSMGRTVSLDLFSLKSAYENHALRVSEVINEVLYRIEKYKSHNIWINTRKPEELLAEAKKLEQRDRSRLPLFGIPFAVKDNIDFVGLPTTAACPEFSYWPEQTAFAVQLLIDAGAILIGKTNMDQFATGLNGTRSPQPYGICKNALNPDYIAGGSSSGSAVAVALNIVSFSLGTDTAGSGRVPAAFNNVVGLKPTRGLISCNGVVPACQSLDCVSLFTQNASEAEFLFRFLTRFDPNDVYIRKTRELFPFSYPSCENQLRFGIPKLEQLNYFGDEESPGLFNQTLDKLQKIGEIVEIDFAPFLEAAALLYSGPWIAERYAGIRPFIEANLEALHPTIREILLPAQHKSGIETFEALHRLQYLKHKAELILSGLSCIVTPTAPRIYCIDEMLADPVQLNNNLGYYTNFMNLLDLSAVAMPSGFYSNGLPFGVTLFSTALADLHLLTIARYVEQGQLPTGKQEGAYSDDKNVLTTNGYRKVAVCGAHMKDLPLNRQLLELGARFCANAWTTPNYRLYRLAVSAPERPGLIRDESEGKSIALELWELPKNRWADFIANIKSPLCIGSVELENGLWESGFLCEHYPIANSKEITHLGGWRKYLETVSAIDNPI